MAQGLKNWMLDKLPRGMERGRAETPAAKWGFAGHGLPWRHDARRDERAGVFLGYDDAGQVTWHDDRHVLTCAGSRSGKGVSLIIPNLFVYENSVLVIDPKGENAATTADRRRAPIEQGGLGQRVHILDPFGVSGEESACFNPLQLINPQGDEGEGIDTATLICNALVVQEGRDSHWSDKARDLLRALILFLKVDDPLLGRRQHLGTVRDLVALKGPYIAEYMDEFKTTDAQRALFLKMERTDPERFGGIVAGVARQYLGDQTDEKKNIISNLEKQTAFLDSPQLRATLESSSFAFADLKAAPTSVYLCLPASHMRSHARWLRSLISLALFAFQQGHGAHDTPVLAILDEFPVLGHMADVETAAGYIAGFGVKLWFVVQNLGQLEHIYGKGWETLIGNAGAMTFFGNSEPATLDYITRRLGVAGIMAEERSGAGFSERARGASGTREQYREVPLMVAHEIEQIFERDAGLMLVIATGKPPLILSRATYWKREDYFHRFTGKGG